MEILSKKIVLLIFMSYYGKIEAEDIEVQDRYYPRYHLAPTHGWMNDPNGFCFFHDEYHLFYQYNPNSSLSAGIAHWGHAKTKDLLHWEHQPIAMYPDQWYDQSGVFSGSALIENDTMYFFYTGNVNYPNQTLDDVNRQALAKSNDGVSVTKFEHNPIINGTYNEPNRRDPKVWKHENTYYMVLGNSFNNDSQGCILLYSSVDKISWREVSVVGQSNGSLGYMWECPDLFELDGKFILLFSPQGIEPQGDKYRNLYQVGYFVGSFDYSTHTFTIRSEFKELDHGHDYYATQTILDALGRRVVVAWFDMWEQNYPEGNDGFTGMMTLPRELKLSTEGTLIQRPLKEIISIRIKQVMEKEGNYTLSNKAGEIIVLADSTKDFVLYIASNIAKVTISYDATKGQVTLDRGGTDGVRRTEWKPTGQLKWRIFVDASSIELFCGEGEVTFSSRFFPENIVNVYPGSISADLNVYELSCMTVPRGTSQ